VRLRHVGAALRTLRLLRGEKACDLAARTGITRAMLSSYERNVHSPSLRTLFDLLTALEVDLYTFQRAIEAEFKVEQRRRALLDPPDTTR